MWGLSSIKQIVAWRQRCVMSASVCSWEDVCFHNSQCFLSPKYLQSDALHCNIRKIQWKQRQTGIKRKSLFVFLSIFLLKEMTPTEKSQSPPGRKRLMVAGIQVHLEIYFSCFVVYISIPLNFRKSWCFVFGTTLIWHLLFNKSKILHRKNEHVPLFLTSGPFLSH